MILLVRHHDVLAGSKEFLVPSCSFMNFLFRLKQRIKREAFFPTWFGLIVNPVYIVRRGLFEIIKENASQLSGNILDVGCGSKPYAALFSGCDRYVGCDIEVSGHDHSDSLVDCFFDGKVLPFRDGEFDAVVSFEVFEHVFDLPSLLKEIHRVTKDEGWLLISVPFVWAEHEAPFDFARYSSYGLAHLLQEHGYRVVSLQKTGNHLLVVFQLLIAYICQYLSPKGRGAWIVQLVVVFPLMLLAHLLDRLLPGGEDLFCGCVALARKGT